jgi:hypothetical protein
MPFSIRSYSRFHGMAFVVCLLSLSSVVGADSLWNGTWILRGSTPGSSLTMKVEEVGTGWKLTHRVVGPDAPAASTVSTVLTPLDGKEVPVLVNGKPTGQTMGIKKIDSRHTVTVMKFQGKEMSVSKTEISPNGKILTVETEYAAWNPIGPAAKQIEYWNRQ